VARPPFSISSRAAGRLVKIERLLGTWSGALGNPAPPPQLRRTQRVRTVLDTVAIEGNRLSLEQATAVLQGKRVLGPAREILEIQNANRAYARVATWNPSRKADLLSAHRVLMHGLIGDAGRFRTKQVGVLQGQRVAHLAPPPHRVTDLMRSLLSFVRNEREAPAIVVAIVFHYELELIHPFSDGNGRIGRLWQHALLRRASPVFEYVPAESLIREQQRDYYAALASADRAGRCDPFLDFMLQILLRALERAGGQLRGHAETASERLDKARAMLGKRWFRRKEYLTVFPRLSTASASRDLVHGLSTKRLASRGEHALTRYRFR
jgi:Fic family protein